MIVIVAITWFSCYRGEMAMVILAVFLAKAFEALSDIFYGLHLSGMSDWILWPALLCYAARSAY